MDFEKKSAVYLLPSESESFDNFFLLYTLCEIVGVVWNKLASVKSQPIQEKNIEFKLTGEFSLELLNKNNYKINIKISMK